MSTEPLLNSVPRVSPAIAAIDDGSESETAPLEGDPHERMLQHINSYVHPSARDVKSGKLPSVDSFPHWVAKLCCYSLTVSTAERQNILSFVDSEQLHPVASCTLSTSLKLSPDERLVVTKQFNNEVKE